MNDDIPGAMKDLDEALGINANDIESLLLRSNLHVMQGHEDKANADVEKLQKLAPDLPQVLRSEEHTSELQSQSNLVCRLLLEKKKLMPSQEASTTRTSLSSYRVT